MNTFYISTCNKLFYNLRYSLTIGSNAYMTNYNYILPMIFILLQNYSFFFDDILATYLIGPFTKMMFIPEHRKDHSDHCTESNILTLRIQPMNKKMLL